jgi:phospholipid/cholesterol/gamma-HCH transport system substrate-binding protein
MERNAHYAAVGLATLVLFLGLILFVVWLARFSVARNYDYYDVLFEGPVRGLSNGGEVHFNGIKVGEVTDLKLDPRNTTRVIATVRLNNNVPVKVDSRAQLEPLGITGVNYIQITAGRPDTPLLKLKPHPGTPYPVILSQPGPLSELLDSSGLVIGRATETLDRANKMLSDENIQNFAKTLRNLEEVSEALNEHKAVLAKAETALDNASEAAKQLAELSKSGRSLLEGDGARTLKNAADATAEIDAAAKDVHALMAKLKGPTTSFAEQGLPELSAAAVSLQQTSDEMRRLIEDARRSPQGFIAKAPSKEVEIQP